MYNSYKESKCFCYVEISISIPNASILPLFLNNAFICLSFLLFFSEDFPPSHLPSSVTDWNLSLVNISWKQCYAPGKETMTE